MNQYSFTAQELLCMAYFSGFDTICGIPDVFSVLAQEDAAQAFQKTQDDLMAGGILEMDFDGAVSLKEDYWGLMVICCDCARCLTVNSQKMSGNCQTQIFWMYDDICLMAETMGEKYVFYTVDPNEVAYAFAWQSGGRADMSGVAIPNVLLRKAKKQLSEGKQDACLRTLCQNGASKEIADVIMGGFMNQAEFLEINLIAKQEEAHRVDMITFLGSRDLSLEVIQTQVAFRDHSKFLSKGTDEVNARIRNICAEFLGR